MSAALHRVSGDSGTSEDALIQPLDVVIDHHDIESSAVGTVIESATESSRAVDPCKSSVLTLI